MTRRTKLLVAFACLWPLVAWSGCGGADGVGGSGRQQTILLESDGALDGFVRTDGTADASGSGPGVGDLDNSENGLAFRMFYSFDLREVPPGAIVTAVTLRVFQAGTVGDPFGNLGELLVDHVDFGDALDAGDYAGGTLRLNVGVLSRDPLRIYKNLGVAEAVLADLDAGRARVQFRLRFPVDGNRDGGNDVLLLEDGETSRGTGNVPLLEVTYISP